MPNPKFSFNLKPKEAIEYLGDKGFKQSFNYDEIMHEAHHKSFTVAKMMNDDLLKDVHASLLKSQEDGIGFKEWKKNIKPTLKNQGWYGETDVVDPKTGEVKTIFVGSRRLRTIYETNMRVSHAVGRYKKLNALPLAKYWMYVSLLLPTTRTSHSDMHGKVLPREDAWWNTNYPPNAWNCKCKVRAYSKRDLEKRGIEVAATSPESIASKDWAYHVGKTDTSNLQSLRKKKVLEMPKELKKNATESMVIDEAFQKSYQHAPAPLQSYILTHRPKHKVVPEQKKPARYDTKTQTMLLKEKQVDPIIYRHELGHHVDTINGLFSVEAITKTLKKDQVIWKQNKHLKEISKLEAKTQNDVHVHDIIYLVSKRKHGEPTRTDDYVITQSVTTKEVFANIFEMILTADGRLDTIRKYFPATVEKVEQMLKDLK